MRSTPIKKKQRACSQGDQRQFLKVTLDWAWKIKQFFNMKHLGDGKDVWGWERCPRQRPEKQRTLGTVREFSCVGVNCMLKVCENTFI